MTLALLLIEHLAGGLCFLCLLASEETSIERWAGRPVDLVVDIAIALALWPALLLAIATRFLRRHLARRRIERQERGV